MCRTVKCIAIFLLLLPVCALAQSREGYLLVATYELIEPGRGWMCRNFAMIQEEVPDKATYELRRKALNQEYKANDIFIRLVSPDEAVMVFEYDKKPGGWGCTKKVISVRVGKDLASCQRQIDNDVRAWPSDYNTTPNLIYQRTPVTATGKQDVRQNWDGVKVEYTFLKIGTNERFVAVRAENTLPNKVAVIGVFRVINSLQETMTKPTAEYRMNPGEKLVIQLKPAGDYRIGLQLVDPPKAGTPFSVINWVKAQIRAQVDKDGGVKDSKYKKTGSSGVRG